MKNIVKDKLISQQIDIAIIGSRSFQLLQILLDQDLDLIPLPKLKNKYLDSLQQLYPQGSNLGFHRPRSFPSKLPQSKIQKYTTNLLTQSFWLQFNFFYFGVLSYDPLLANITRGHISICIIVTNEQDIDSSQLKKISMKQNNEPASRFLIDFHQTVKNISNRQQLLMEQKIINLFHNFKLNQYSSILTLKLIDKNRIIQGTSNIKLNRNQILRWIVDRHFENQFGIKLNVDVGDQIQNYHQVVQESYCKLI